MKIHIFVAAVLAPCLAAAPVLGDIGFFSWDGVNPATDLTVSVGDTYTLYLNVAEVDSLSGYQVGLYITGPAYAVASSHGTWFSSQGTFLDLYGMWSPPNKSGALFLEANATGGGDVAVFDIECTGYGETTIALTSWSVFADECANPIPMTFEPITVQQIPAPASIALLSTGVVCLASVRARCKHRRKRHGAKRARHS